MTASMKNPVPGSWTKPPISPGAMDATPSSPWGAGSVIDTGKAVSGMVPNPGDIVDYLEGVGTGRIMEHDPLPMIAAPTTSGTGSERTKNAVITSREEGFKRSFRTSGCIRISCLSIPSSR